MCYLKKLVLIFIVSCCFSNLSAQESNEYRLEIGPMGGISSYLGDANQAFYSNITPAYGLMLRYRFDTRVSIRGEYNFTSAIAGSGQQSFTNKLNVIDFAGEFNFFDLEKSKYKRFSKMYTPYIFVGIGGMLYPYEGKQSFGMSIPFGVGFKVKLMNRLNLNLQFSNRLLFRDNMEGIEMYNDPYKLNGSNLLNNDFISSLTIGLTFDFWMKKCDCNQF